MSEHGTATHYKNKGCRCEACRTAASAYNAALRARGKGNVADNGRIANRVRSLCVQHIKANDPALYQQMLDSARSELGIPRRKPGRPSR